MRNAKLIGFVLLLGAVICVGWLVLAQKADGSLSPYSDARSTVQVHKQVTKLTRELSEASHVERATRLYSKQYGSSVGRWVWLARDVGWSWNDIPQLMYVIDRESGGSPTAKNPTSTASGLLQFLAFHFDGTGDYGWVFNPYNARQNLTYGYKLHRMLGWAPWAI